MSTQELPELVMSKLPDWRFWELSTFDDIDEFEKAVTDWQTFGEEDAPPVDWKPHELALPVPRVRVQYFGVHSPDDDEYDDFFADLTADDPAGFSNRELLFKLHNSAVGHLNAVDHCYFEGLILKEPGGPNEPPLYQMRQGS